MQTFVSALLLFKNNVLLLHHRKLNRLLQVGGKLENGEGGLVASAIRREVLEETNICRPYLLHHHLPVLEFDNYEAKRFSFRKWDHIRNEINRSEAELKLPKSAPIGIVRNKSVLDMFFVFTVRSKKVKINTREHKSYSWVNIDKLGKKTGYDPVLTAISPFLKIHTNKQKGYSNNLWFVQRNKLKRISSRL